MTKSLKDISWQVTEDTYRADPALSYSILAKYERSGFNGLGSLFTKVSSPSLTLGSAVDSIITGGEEEFNSRFLVADFPAVSDNITSIAKTLFSKYSNTHQTLQSIPDQAVIDTAGLLNFQSNWKPETRARVIKEKGSEYYSLMHLAKDKTILDSDTYRDVRSMVRALKESRATEWYFMDDNPLDNIERLYQLKFKATFNDVEYRVMLDLVVVDHDNKTIRPVDLKTSSKKEYDFPKSFIEWNYQIQNRLYTRVLENNIKKDDYFKDFTILPYIDIVVCKDSLCPLVWECPFSKEYGTLTFGRDRNIIMRDPFEIGQELKGYLDSIPKVPDGIDMEGKNNLKTWLDKL